jgi:hypothetical protein
MTRKSSGQRRRQHAGAAAKIEVARHPSAKSLQKSKSSAKPSLNFGKSKDRWNGQSSPFHQSAH